MLGATRKRERYYHRKGLYHQKKPKNPIEMELTTLQKINNLIKDLPDYLAEELLEYIEYLVYKFHKDEDLSDEQKRVILRGLEDIKYGRSHLNEITETE
jgi:hypothetical protein